MALTSGFFNSVDGDRKYNAEDFGAIFSGVIKDGIFMSIGDQLKVTTNNGMVLNIGTGKAWFDNIWVVNDALYPIALDASELLYNRIDSIILEVNKTRNVRTAAFKVVKGTPSQNPVAPTLERTETVNQYALANVYVASKTTGITASNITNRVGTSSTPFVTGILSTINTDSLIQQWNSEWRDWVNEKNSHYAEMDQDFNIWKEGQEAGFIDWSDEQKEAFTTWLDTLKAALDETVAYQLYQDLNKTKAIIADPWDASTTYQINDYVVHNSDLYKCMKESLDEEPSQETVSSGIWFKTLVTDEFGEGEHVFDANDILYGNTTVEARLDRTPYMGESSEDVLLDKNGNEFYPKTRTDNVYTPDGERLDNVIDAINNDLSDIRSHIGMIIHSSTLDTEAKVIAIYGGVSWSKIEGRFLLGQSRDYTVNSIGGSATNTLTVANLPSHYHGLNDHTHSFAHTHGTDSKGSHTHSIYWRQAQNFDGNHNRWYMCPSPDTITDSGVDASGAHTHTTNSQSTTTTGKASGNTTSTGSGTAINNMPPYKTVYIWERTA